MIRGFMKSLNNVNIAGFREFNEQILDEKIQAKLRLTQCWSPKQAVYYYFFIKDGKAVRCV